MRTDRNRVICLTNDHKDVMARIEKLMHELHAAARCGGWGALPAVVAFLLEGGCGRGLALLVVGNPGFWQCPLANSLCGRRPSPSLDTRPTSNGNAT